ncbi:MAG: ATP-dependent metallopeptidase FtsH/Yme1/Tma family protein [Deltaproteobacteria bacterium]|nr:ATP-dependent metallopeptidase FtsH/Yme1/Tma family protein [Deltaproteobacteria bacterium]
MNPTSRNALFWLVLALLFLTLYSVSKQQEETSKELAYSDFLHAVESGKVTAVSIEGNNIEGTYRNRTEKFKTIAPKHEGLIDTLRKADVQITVKEPTEQPWYLILLVNALPMLLLIGVWIFFMRQMQIGAGKGLSFGKSRARLLTESQQKVTFEDVAGIDEARAELQEVIEFLKDPKKFTRLGGRIPKGVLLVGSPGTGKTLLAKAIAGEAGVPFFSISGSDFVEMFVGVGASRVRDLFIQGKKSAPCIIFIDEIDAVGRHRGAGMGGGHDEREQTLNQLLVEMDGFESNEGVILIAATNRPDVLDPALLRPGRFDRQVVVPTPDLNGRVGILKVHTKKTPLAKDVELEVIARGTPGFTGADLEILVNEAALSAARQGKENLGPADFEFAKDKVMMGAERRSLLLTDEEKKTTAYHESGHALVAKMVPNADPVHKLTIVPRGMALGLMQQLPENDKHTYSKNYWLDQLAVFFGGRGAEELVFDDVNTGASSDIERATKVARRMVCEWGMSDRIGPLHYSSKDEHVFLGREIGRPREHSEQTQVEIDAEVRAIVESQRMRAKNLLQENLDKLHNLASALLERETLNSDQIDAIMRGETLPPPEPITAATTNSASKESQQVPAEEAPPSPKQDPKTVVE